VSVEFFFDVVCPFAYLAATRIEAVAAERGATVAWRPVLLGGVFASNGVPSDPNATMPAAKRRLVHLDMQRQASLLGVPLRIPEAHPRRTVDAMRLLLAVDPARVPELAGVLFRAYWAEGRDVADRAVLQELAGPFGLDVERVVGDPAIKDALRSASDAAAAEGVFGVPTFKVGDRLIWGVDRLHFLEEALGRAPERVPAGPGTVPELELFHDLSSPFAYLAHTQAPRIADEAGAKLVETPILLGALFRDLGTPNVPLRTYAAARQRWQLRDMEDWARRWGVPFSFPSTFPLRTVTPLRVALVEPATTASLYRAAWVEDRDIGDADVLRGVLDDNGFDGAALVARAEEPAIKDRLRANTTRARDLGVCGVPTWRVGEDLYWGQDRIPQVERALRGWRVW
jgi:2-hydroxychromene-2-carboxylate isomerase